jgi:DNA transposition AAA+ family ATPase
MSRITSIGKADSMTATPAAPAASRTVAPLANVALCLTALERAMQRPSHLPGIVVLYGPSGWGKSFAAAHAANRHRCYYVEAKSTWSKRDVVKAILKEMGISPAVSTTEMLDQVAEQLVLSKRPLIVDEVDHLVKRAEVQIVRDLYEASKAPILLIGEEQLPVKLKKYERFHGRVLQWAPAQPVTIEDAQALRRLYCTRATIADDLLAKITDTAAGSARRVVVNLELVQEEAAIQGWESVDLARWGKRDLYTGDAPRRGG